MLDSIGTAWIPAAVAFALPALVLFCIWVADARSRRGGSDESDGSDGSDGGGGVDHRQPPRRPPPVSPVDWPQFEREFAEYVALCAQRSARRPRARADDDRRAALIVVTGDAGHGTPS